MRRLALAAPLVAAPLVAACLAAVTLPAAAQQAAPQTPVTEESIERGLVNLGLMAGHAVQCAPDAQRAEMQRMLLAFNSILVAEMGSNAAFRWATAFGAGSSAPVDRSYCDRSLADWQRHVQANRLDR